MASVPSRHVLIIPVIALIAGLLFVCFYLYSSQKGSQKESYSEAVSSESQKDKQKPTITTLPALWSPTYLYQALEHATSSRNITLSHIRAGVVPHHDLASEMIASFFVTLKASANPKTFIIVGPNHSDVGIAPGISGHVSWQTPFGTVSQDGDILDALVAEHYLAYDEKVYQKEHSISTLAPFIKYYFPDATIVPIILSSNYGYKETLALADRLAEYLKDPETVLLASVDFSHYLPTDVADQKDEVTRKAIEDRAYEQISRMNSEYLDSPLSITTLLRAMRRIDVETLQLLDHKNSGAYLGGWTDRSTGYFTMFFGVGL